MKILKSTNGCSKVPGFDYLCKARGACRDCEVGGGSPWVENWRFVTLIFMELRCRYVEVHMEQGPILEAEGLPLGVVTGIAGQTRQIVMISGTQVPPPFPSQYSPRVTATNH